MRLAARVFLPRIVLLESNRWPYRVLTFLIHAIHYSVTILKALCKSKCSGVENGDASFPFLSSILQSTRKSTATLKNTVQISRKKTWKMSKYNRVKIWWLSKKLKSILKKNIENQAFHLVYFLKQGSTFFCKIVWLLWRQIIPSNWEDRWKVVPSSHKHLIELCSTDAALLSSILHIGLKVFLRDHFLLSCNFIFFIDLYYCNTVQL